MPTINEAVGGLIENAIKNPRSTVASILTFLITGIPVLLGTGLIHGKAATIAFSIVGSAKLIWGTFFQKDAGQTLAYVPGNPVPQSVPSHEIPNDPQAIPAPPEVKP